MLGNQNVRKIRKMSGENGVLAEKKIITSFKIINIWPLGNMREIFE